MARGPTGAAAAPTTHEQRPSTAPTTTRAIGARVGATGRAPRRWHASPDQSAAWSNRSCTGRVVTVSSPSRFAAEFSQTAPSGPRPGRSLPTYRHVGAKTVAADSATTGACPCPCPPRSPRPSPRWPNGSPTGAAGVPTTRSAPSTSSTRPPACGAWPRSSTAPPSRSGIPMSEAEGIQMGFIEGRVNPSHTMVSVNAPPERRTRSGSPSPRTWSPSPCSAPPTGTAWPTPPTGPDPDGGRLYNGYPASSITEDGASRPRDPADPDPGVPGPPARRGPGQGPRAARARLPDHPGDLDAACALGGPHRRAGRRASWSAPARPPISPSPAVPASGAADRSAT